MKGKMLGIIIFLVIIGVGLYYYFSGGGDGGIMGEAGNTLKGYVGGEKLGFLHDDEVAGILRRTYDIALDYYKAGSIEMVKAQPSEDTDFLWPSSQVALELFKMDHPGKLIKSDIVFNSPIVLYSWDVVADALMKQGIVEQVDETYYVVDFPRLIELVIQGAAWSEIGLPELYGKVSIVSTDPTKSNSGNMFSGLLATILNGGEVVTESSINGVLPQVVDFFQRLGYLEHSSGDLFEQYLRTGVGAKPIIVGYENQIVEFSLKHRDLWPKVKDHVRILYPVPTVWSAHPVMAVTEPGKSLIAALQDEALQKIAWERHGFRTGMMGVENDPRVLEIAGIPESITKVVAMPDPRVMDRIIRALQGEPISQIQ